MVKILSNLFNKRKIERLNGVVAKLQQELRMCNTFATTTNAKKLEVERYLREITQTLVSDSYNICKEFSMLKVGSHMALEHFYWQDLK
jgi:hypothetical protein